MTATARRPGTRSAFWITLCVGVLTGLFGAIVAFMAQIGVDSQAHPIPMWGWLFLPLVVIGAYLAGGGWNRFRSRLLVIAGLALALVPLAVNGYLTARAFPFGWEEVYASGGLFVAFAFVLVLVLLLAGSKPTFG